MENIFTLKQIIVTHVESIDLVIVYVVVPLTKLDDDMISQQGFDRVYVNAVKQLYGGVV